VCVTPLGGAGHNDSLMMRSLIRVCKQSYIHGVAAADIYCNVTLCAYIYDNGWKYVLPGMYGW